MGRKLSRSELVKHKDNALRKLDTYITSLINDPNPNIQGKSDKLSYWIEDWSTFLSFESKFSPKSLRRYKRGEIIKVHLGYNVGSEEGGLHYCVVVEKDNSKNSPVVTVVPLTSVKKKTDLEHLVKGNIYLGNELFTNLNSKISHTCKTFVSRMTDLKTTIDNLSTDTSPEVFSDVEKEMEICRKELELLDRMKNEVQKMKIGSIAIVPQIRTISKIRIYDPKTNYDILSNVKLSNEKLDLLDTEIIKLFTGQKIDNNA